MTPEDLVLLAMCKKASGGGGGGGDDAGSYGTSGTISLPAQWTAGSNGTYTATATANGYSVTGKTVVNLVTDAAVISQMLADGVRQIYVSNSGAALTAVAIGGYPSNAMELQAIFSEVS